jgi:hypothetical protein
VGGGGGNLNDIKKRILIYFLFLFNGKRGKVVKIVNTTFLTFFVIT